MKKLKTYNVAGLPTVDIRELNDLQGNLKEMSDTDEQKVANELTTSGVRFPFYAWKDPKGKYWMIDGTGRKNVILKRDFRNGQGKYDFPVLLVYANGKSDAAKNILRVSSEYNKKHKEGLTEFVLDHKIEGTWIEENTTFADSFNMGWGIAEETANGKGESFKGFSPNSTTSNDTDYSGLSASEKLERFKTA